MIEEDGLIDAELMPFFGKMVEVVSEEVDFLCMDCSRTHCDLPKID
jgi:hypothetical protein